MRQISGEVYAAAQASTCCDVTGEESPNGAPRKMHAFCGVPGLEGDIKITPETNGSFEASLSATNILYKALPRTRCSLAFRTGGDFSLAYNLFKC